MKFEFVPIPNLHTFWYPNFKIMDILFTTQRHFWLFTKISGLSTRRWRHNGGCKRKLEQRLEAEDE